MIKYLINFIMSVSNFSNKKFQKTKFFLIFYVFLNSKQPHQKIRLLNLILKKYYLIFL